MPTAVGVADFRKDLGEYLDRARLGETILINSFNRPIARLGPPTLPGGLDVAQLTADARELEKVLRAKHGGDLDKMIADAQALALASVAVAMQVEAERQQKRGAPEQPDHK